MSQIKSTKGDYNAFFRQLFFIIALVFIGLVIWKQLAFFLSCFLGAVTFYIVLRSPLFYLTEKKRWKSWQASLLLVAGMSIVLLGIGFLVFEVVASEVSKVDASSITQTIEGFIDHISGYLNHPLIPKDLLGKSQNVIGSLVSGLLNTAYNFIFNLLMMLFVLYFMFANARKMERVAIEYMPFRGESLSMIEKEAKGMIFSNAVGLPLIMIAQGLSAALGYWLFGIDNVVFWAFLTAILGLVPVVGSAGVWLPLGVFMIATGNVWQGVALLLYGALVITNIDNLCRLILMKKMTNTHPLIVIFGVILGIPLFGFWGIIFGPLLISGFLLLMKIYHIEFTKRKNHTEEEIGN